MDKIINDFIKKSLAEDIGDGDITSEACIDKDAIGKAQLIAKENGQIAGIDIAKKIYSLYNNQLDFTSFKKDGETIKKNDIIFSIFGNQHSILATERLVLNCIQRMSGIATKTRKFVDKIQAAIVFNFPQHFRLIPNNAVNNP